MKLQTKLLTSQLSLAIIPAAVIAAIILWQTTSASQRVISQAESGLQESTEVAHDALVDAARTDLAHMAESVRAMCQTQQDLLEQKLHGDLNVAAHVMRDAGPISFAEETVAWQAMNQYTKDSAGVSLPKMLMGGEWLGQNADVATASALVDNVKQLVGGTCTIFQRMNAAGDMLRVSTNVEKQDGTRAIGTYIPAVNPDGTPNPVVSTVMRGETFYGRAFVVDAWYITGYQPLNDANGDVVGVLYVGIPEESVASLRKAIMSTQVGDTGYIYVLNAQGQSRGHYVISKDGKRDGEDISQAKDANGKPFILEICDLAPKLKPGEIGEARYAWKNAGDTQARDKVVKIAYFEPWDWVIGVGSYEDEFYAAANEMDAKAREVVAAAHETDRVAMTTVTTWCLGAGAILLAISATVALGVARRIAKPLSRVIAGLNEGADQVSEASSQVASAAQGLAEGASEQASSLEETSAALEEMATQTRTSAERAQKANELASQARNNAAAGDKTMGQLNGAMAAINDSSGRISKIIKVIEEIAFQTNLLALNAAVEAARAGEHGKGFAVVADEVRNLAQRAAQASGEVTGLIEDSVSRAKDGTDVAAEVGQVLAAIGGDVTQVAELLSGITQTAEEQAQGVEQINMAVSQMDRLTQQNAAGAEQSASAAEELSAQSQTVRGMVAELVGVVGGGGAAQHRADASGGVQRTGLKVPGPGRAKQKPIHGPSYRMRAGDAASESMNGSLSDF